MINNSRVVGVIILLLIFCASFAAEPTNIHFIKQQLIQYHNSGQYSDDQGKVIASAKMCLAHQIQNHRSKYPLALVLDIDETALSSYEFNHQVNFGWKEQDYQLAVKRANMKVIPATLRLYKFAKHHGIAVFFISGRHEKLRDATIRNLKAAGYEHWDGLYLRSTLVSSKNTIVAFKSQTRKLVSSMGYKLIGNVGDQYSDLTGDDIRCKFKLPNPFYFIG